MFLIFDSETSGLPNKRPISDESQPHLVELAGVLCEEDGHERASFNFIVRPDGWEIPDEVAAIHGITTDIALRSGVPLKVVVVAFAHLMQQATTLIAHNAEFDCKILDIAMHRAEYVRPRPSTRCTMKMATPVLKLPPTPKMLERGMVNHYKRPSLQEAHQALLGCGFEGAHRAIDDARAASRVFFKLKEMGCV